MLLTLCEGNPQVTGGFPSQISQWYRTWIVLFLAWTCCWTINRFASDLRRHEAHVTSFWYDGLATAPHGLDIPNRFEILHPWEKLCRHKPHYHSVCLCFIHMYCITHFMMTSSNGNIFRVTGPLCGEFTGPGEFPPQRPVTRSFDVFFDLRLNKRLSKQPWGWWFETHPWTLWRHCNDLKICYSWSTLNFRYIGQGSHNKYALLFTTSQCNPTQHQLFICGP